MPKKRANQTVIPIARIWANTETPGAGEKISAKSEDIGCKHRKKAWNSSQKSSPYYGWGWRKLQLVGSTGKYLCVHHFPSETPASCPLKINAKVQHPEGVYKRSRLFPVASPRADQVVSDLF